MIYTFREAAYEGARRGIVHRCPLPNCEHPSACEWDSGIDSTFCVEHQSMVTVTQLHDTTDKNESHHPG